MQLHPLAQPLAEIIATALPEGADLSIGDICQSLSSPPDARLGDYAFPCFRLAKALKLAPPKIALIVAEKLSELGSPWIESATAAGPYVNIRLGLAAAGEAVISSWASGAPIEFPQREGRVMVEYSQPNTHKAFHVGHMRNLCLGDSIIRSLRGAGYEVVAANYFGDVGTHIAKCLWGLEQLSPEQAIAPEEGRGEWLGKIYAQSAIALADLEEAAKTDEAKAKEYQAARARMTELLRGIEERDPEVYKLWQETRQWSLDEFAEIYRWCDASFDHNFCESDVDGPSLALVDEFLEKGIFVESEGAVGIFNEEIKHMPFFMLLKRDKTSLYSTKDLALARLKFEQFEIDRSIYVVDVRQSDHFRHVFLTLAKMGFAQASNCEHVPYEMVELPTGPMAGRTGTVVLFRSLREAIIKELQEGYFAKYRGQWADTEIDEAVHQIALGAIRYGMLNRDVNQKIVFDLPAWLRFDGNTGPYLQYVAARTSSILRKAQDAGKALPADIYDDHAARAAAYASLVEESERGLIIALAGMPAVVEQVATQLRPSVLCTYLFALAKVYNRFQDECRVLQSEGDLLVGRLLLVKATREALRFGLQLLGIPAPERM